MCKLTQCLLIVMIFLVPSRGYTVMYSYMYSRDTVIKLDVVNNTIVSSFTAQSEIKGFNGVDGGYAVIDLDRNYLLTGIMRGEFGFNVYDAKTLEFKKFVPYPSVDSESYEYRFIYPENDDLFYVQIQNNKSANADEMMKNMSFGKEDLAYKGLVANVLTTIYEDYWFSEDGTKIYVESDDRRLRVHDSKTFSLMETIDMASFSTHDIKGLELSDISNEKLLISIRHLVPGGTTSHDSLLTYDTKSKTVTQIFGSGIETYDEYFVPMTNKVIVDEVIFKNQYFMRGLVLSLKLFMYDYESGKQLGKIEFPKTGLSGKILSISPTGKMLIYIAYGINDKENNLYIIDLNSFEIVSTLKVPIIDFIIFREEPDEAPAQ